MEATRLKPGGKERQIETECAKRDEVIDAEGDDRWHAPCVAPSDRARKWCRVRFVGVVLLEGVVKPYAWGSRLAISSL